MSSDRQGNPEPVSQHISMIQLPKRPLLWRVSDDRVGYFETSFVQLGLNDETGERQPTDRNPAHMQVGGAQKSRPI